MEKDRDNLALAVTVIVLTVLTLSLGDAIIKTLSADLVLWQIFVLRSLVAIPLLLILLHMRFPDISLIPRSLGWTAARSLMLALMWVAYYASLPHLQLSIAAAAYYTLPIFITLFSAVLVGEPVNRAGWFAVVLGFVGTLLILKPAADAFNLYALLPVASAMLYALAMILTRTKCRDEHPLVLSAALNVTFILIGLLATVFGSIAGDTGTSQAFMSPKWSSMDGNAFAAIGLLGVAILVASIGTAVAYQNGPSSVVATFDFAYVGFAVIWGLVFFSELPDLVSVGGMLLIVIAGIVSIRQGRTIRA
ncbi:MAG: DMT family transporter [Geminicoccaceae bacterium]